MMDLITTILCGSLVGISLALTGAGGAILAVPLLVYFQQLPMSQAAPISLFTVCASAGMGAMDGLRKGIVRYRAAMVIAIAGAIFAPLGLMLAAHIPNRPLMLAFAAVLAYVAYRALQSAWRHPNAAMLQDDSSTPCVLDPNTGRFVWNARCGSAMLGIGSLAGLLSGLLGVGGGFVIVPALRRHTNAHANAIVATSLAVITLVSFSGVVAVATSGKLDWQVALPFAAGALVAMQLGRRLATHVQPRVLQASFALAAVVAAGSLLLKVVQG